MAVLKYKDPSGEWIEVGLSQQSTTPEGIGAIPVPEGAQEGQILTYNGESWEAADAPEGGVTSVNEKTGDVKLTPADIGLDKVENIRQYSANNEPPYPVVTVNGVSAENQNVTLTVDNIEGAAKLSTKLDLTLSASAWTLGEQQDSDYFEYRITNEAIKENSFIEAIAPSTMTKEQLEAFGNALVIGSTQSEGELILKALGEVPSIDIPITLIIRGDL